MLQIVIAPNHRKIPKVNSDKINPCSVIIVTAAPNKNEPTKLDTF